jgi:hypothetical protein
MDSPEVCPARTPFPYEPLFGDDAVLNSACEALYYEHVMVRSLLEQTGDTHLSCTEFKELFASIFREHISDPFVNGVVDVLSLIYDTQISSETEGRIRAVVNTAVDEFSALIDAMFKILTTLKDEGEYYATKPEVVVLAAMFSLLWAGKPPLKWQTVAAMFFRLIDPGEGSDLCIELPDILKFAKDISQVLICASKGVVAVLCSFEICFQGELSEQVDDLFTTLDKDQDGGLSMWELMEPLVLGEY